MTQFLKKEKDLVFYIRLKDVLGHVLVILKKMNIQKLLMMQLSLYLENQGKYKKVFLTKWKRQVKIWISKKQEY